jgi:Transcriptional regulator PadR-like family
MSARRAVTDATDFCQAVGVHRTPRPGLMGLAQRPSVTVLALLAAGIAAGSVAAAHTGSWWLARVLAVIFLAVQTIWSLPRWRSLVEQRRLRAELAALALQGRQATAILVLWAVADGCHDAPTIKKHVGVVGDIDADLDRLERTRLLLGEWEEQPGQPTRRRYRLTSTAHAVLTNTLYP